MHQQRNCVFLSQNKGSSPAPDGTEEHELPLTCKSSECLPYASPKAMTGGAKARKDGHSRHTRRGSSNAKSSSAVASVPEKDTSQGSASPPLAPHHSHPQKFGLLAQGKPPPRRDTECSAPVSLGSGATRGRDLGFSPTTTPPAASIDAMSPMNGSMPPAGQSVGSREAMSPAPTTEDRLTRPVAGIMSPDGHRRHSSRVSPSEPFSDAAMRIKPFDSRSFLAYIADEQRELLFTYVAVALTVLALCALLTAILLLAVPVGPQDTVCTTASCTALDSMLAASVDQTRDPCVNFYAHVCSGWAQTRNQSVYRSHLREFLADMHWILARVLVPSQAQTAQQVVAAFYQTCTAVLVDGADELPSFRRQLHLAGVKWPHLSAEPNVIATAASVYATFQVTAMLRIRASRRNTRNVLEVAPDVTFLRGWQDTRDHLIHAGSYARFFEETKNKYAGNEKPANTALTYEIFFKVENAVLQALVHWGKSGGEVEFSRIDSLIQITRNVPTTTWRAVVDKLGLPETAHVAIANLELIRKVDELFSTLGEQLLHYYLGWCVVQQVMRYMSKDIASSWYDYEGISPATDMASEWRGQAECMQLSEKLVGQFTFGRFILWKSDAEDYWYVYSVVSALSAQLMLAIQSSPWSGHSGRLNRADFHVDFHVDAMRVVDEALGKYGLSNRSSLLSNWMDIAAAVSTINATFRDRISTTYTRDLVAEQRYNLYDNQSGALTLPPFYAMLPVYRRHLSETTKFGALGTLFATAIFRLFLARLTGYSVESQEALERLRCFAESAEYRSDRLDLYHHAASVKLALDALRLLPGSSHQRLRMFDSLQVFFVVMCYLFCTPNTSEDTIIAETICNEAVKNSREFAMAFQCSSGALMNPERRCSFF
ncbi:endothelin-converting enzyme 2 [Dermacentor silvarum]|uniref:endothelin-converting enzyme 2 n=1 Tax=Dermacentor silvarum TaxID=543639 RepID=UPI002101A88D|nr:endothelin-converting enzyme 2 [Dermacentor silvarum]